MSRGCDAAKEAGGKGSFVRFLDGTVSIMRGCGVVFSNRITVFKKDRDCWKLYFALSLTRKKKRKECRRAVA